MASQHGEPGKGSGEPYVMKVEHAETSAVMVEHSGVLYTHDHDAHVINNVTTPIVFIFFPFSIIQSF